MEEQDKIHHSIVDLLNSMMSMVPFADALKEDEFKLKVKYSLTTLEKILKAMKEASEIALEYCDTSDIGKL